MKQGDRVKVSGDSAELWIEDYNVRVDTFATVVQMPSPRSKTVLLNLDYIDHESRVCCRVRRSRITEL